MPRRNVVVDSDPIDSEEDPAAERVGVPALMSPVKGEIDKFLLMPRHPTASNLH